MDTLEKQLWTKDEVVAIEAAHALELEQKMSSHQNCDHWKSENGRIGRELISLVNDYYENDTDADTIVSTICSTIDYEPKKEIEFTATIRFTGKMDVDAYTYANGHFDITELLSDAYVDINNGDVVIDTYDIEDAEEC